FKCRRFLTDTGIVIWPLLEILAISIICAPFLVFFTFFTFTYNICSSCHFYKSILRKTQTNRTFIFPCDHLHNIKVAVAFFGIMLYFLSSFCIVLLHIPHNIMQKFQRTSIGYFLFSCLHDSLPAAITAESCFHVDQGMAAGVHVPKFFGGIGAIVPACVALQRSIFPKSLFVPL